MKLRVSIIFRKQKSFRKNQLKLIRVARQTINSLKNGKYNLSILLVYKITILIDFKNIHDIFRFEKDRTQRLKKKTSE